MADKVTMKAVDTVHISNVSSENLNEGDVFTVSEADAKILEDRGLAERGGTASKAVNVDSVASARPETREEIDEERGQKDVKAAPANKMAEEPSNKTISAVSAPAKPAKKGK